MERERHLEVQSKAQVERAQRKMRERKAAMCRPADRDDNLRQATSIVSYLCVMLWCRPIEVIVTTAAAAALLWRHTHSDA